MKRVYILLLFMLFVLFGFSGCRDAREGRVYWLNYKPESDEALQKVARMYEEKTGVSVKIVTAASGT